MHSQRARSVDTAALAALLPPQVEVEATAARDPVSPLLAAEELVVEHAVTDRRAEFAVVRECARRALDRLGYPRVPILPGERREPRWPPGVVGSLTHCTDYRAAAVARSHDVTALGIDAELHEPLPPGTVSLVVAAGELGAIDRLARQDPGVAWDRVMFSAKESIYKAWYPLARRWLGFTDCELNISPEGSFVGRILVAGAPLGEGTVEQLTGRWAIHGNHVLTAVWVPSDQSSRGVRTPTPSPGPRPAPSVVWTPQQNEPFGPYPPATRPGMARTKSTTRGHFRREA